MRTLVALLVCLISIVLFPRAAHAAEKTELERGQAILRVKGCVACHSTDGTARVGPTFRGMIGRPRVVRVNGEGDPREVIVDEAFVAKSLREPDADVAVGYPRGNMPRFDASDDDVRAIVAALRDIDTAPGNVEASGRRGGSIVPLAISAAAFTLLHFFLSSLPVRRRLIASLGEKKFGGIYSLLIFASFGAMIWFYRVAPYIEVWSPPRFTRWIPVLAMPIALLFMVTGFSTPSPTSVGQDKKAAEDPKGIQAITRHPALWGFAIWAAAHLATNGELHVILVALSILVLAVGGMLHIDARRRDALGETWTSYVAKTSLMPFGAIVTKGTKLRLREVGIVRVLITAFLYVTILHTHALVIGGVAVSVRARYDRRVSVRVVCILLLGAGTVGLLFACTSASPSSSFGFVSSGSDGTSSSSSGSVGIDVPPSTPPSIGGKPGGPFGTSSGTTSSGSIDIPDPPEVACSFEEPPVDGGAGADAGDASPPPIGSAVCDKLPPEDCATSTKLVRYNSGYCDGTHCQFFRDVVDCRGGCYTSIVDSQKHCNQK